jgi:hypothetical protein
MPCFREIYVHLHHIINIINMNIMCKFVLVFTMYISYWAFQLLLFFFKLLMSKFLIYLLFLAYSFKNYVFD